MLKLISILDMIPLNTSKHLDYLLWKWYITLLKHKNADTTVKMDIKSKILDIKGHMNNSRTSLMYKNKKKIYYLF